MVCTPMPNVSALLPQVETEDRFEWIGGSSIGGGTFWGLGALLTKTKVILFRTSALWPLDSPCYTFAEAVPKPLSQLERQVLEP